MWWVNLISQWIWGPFFHKANCTGQHEWRHHSKWQGNRPSAGCFCQEMSMALHVSIWDGVVSKRDTTKKTETLVIICKKRLTHIHIHIPSYTNIILIPFLFIIHNLWPFILQPLRNPEATDREIGFVMEAGSNPSRSLSVIDSTGITMIFQETNFITAMDTMIYIYIHLSNLSRTSHIYWYLRKATLKLWCFLIGT